MARDGYMIITETDDDGLEGHAIFADDPKNAFQTMLTMIAQGLGCIGTVEDIQKTCKDRSIALETHDDSITLHDRIFGHDLKWRYEEVQIYEPGDETFAVCK